MQLFCVQEFRSGWLFTYNSSIYVQTGALDHALAGDSSPLFVSRDGKIRELDVDVSDEMQTGGSAISDWIRVQPPDADDE